LSHSFRFHPGARTEFDADTDWYETRGRGEDFIYDVEAAVASVCEHPRRWPLFPHIERVLSVRRRVLRRLPYSVAYIVENQEVVIVAVAHTRRRPGIGCPG